MKAYKLFFPLLMISILGVAQNTNVINTSIKNALDTRMSTLYQELELGGDFLFCIVNKDGIVYSYAKENAQSRTTLTLNTPFYIASHTKAMTGTLLKLMEKQGLINLNATLDKYLPELHFNSKIDPQTITIKDLLSHSHGISNDVVTWKTAYLGYSGSNQELLADFNQYSTYDSTRRFNYSNIGPILAAIVVEKRMGIGWKDLMAKHLFQPLKMDHSSGYVHQYNLKKVAPTSYVQKDNGSKRVGFYKTDNTLHAAGGTITSANDLANWLRFNINKGKWSNSELLSDEDFNALITPCAKQEVTYFTYKRYGYSLGWDLAEYNGERLATRFGGFAGTLTAHISFLPERGLGVIAFTNEEKAYRLPHISANLAYNLLLYKENTWELFESEKDLYKAALAKKATTERVVNNTCSTKQDIEGSYVSSKGWPSVSIKSKKNTLWIQWGETSAKAIITDCQPGRVTLFADFGSFQRDFKIRLEQGNPTIMHVGSLSFSKP